MKESVIQKGIMEYLTMVQRQYNLYWFRAGAGTIRIANKRYFKTGRPGVPDIVVVKDGKFIGLEVKTKTGRQSDAQKLAEVEIKEAGGEYHLVRSISDVKKIFTGE